jgi:hypothetical protein
MKKSIFATIAATLVSTCVFMHVAQAQNAPSALFAVDTAPGKLTAVAGAKFQGKILSVDQATRKIVIVGPKGKQYETIVNEDVKNFSQIKVGDLISLNISKIVVSDVKVRTDGILEREETQSYSHAAIGDKPEGTIENLVKVTANVVAIDKKHNMVTVKGPTQTVKVQVDAEVLKGLKVGNVIEAMIKETVQIKVTAPAKVKK